MYWITLLYTWNWHNTVNQLWNFWIENQINKNPPQNKKEMVSKLLKQIKSFLYFISYHNSIMC